MLSVFRIAKEMVLSAADIVFALDVFLLTHSSKGMEPFGTTAVAVVDRTVALEQHFASASVTFVEPTTFVVELVTSAAAAAEPETIVETAITAEPVTVAEPGTIAEPVTIAAEPETVAAGPETIAVTVIIAAGPVTSAAGPVTFAAPEFRCTESKIMHVEARI